MWKGEILCQHLVLVITESCNMWHVSKQFLTFVKRYNSMFNQWESMAPMPEAVLHPAVAATNQRIYMFGGEDAMQNPIRLIQVK